MSETGIIGSQILEHLVGEQLTRSLNVGYVGSTAGAVTNPGMAVIRLSDGVDVTATVTSGVMSVAGQVITLLAVGGAVGGTPASLDEGEQYRIDVTYDKDGNVDIKNKFFLACPDEEP